MKNTLIEFTKKLISINSRPENKKELSLLLDIVAQELQEYSIFYFERNGVKSILVSNISQIPQQFRLLLNCHLDIIPAKEEQFIPRVQDGKFF